MRSKKKNRKCSTQAPMDGARKASLPLCSSQRAAAQHLISLVWCGHSTPSCRRIRRVLWQCTTGSPPALPLALPGRAGRTCGACVPARSPVGGHSAFACALRQERWQMAAGRRGSRPPARAAPASPKKSRKRPLLRAQRSQPTHCFCPAGHTATGQSAGLSAWIRIALYHYHPQPNLVARRPPPTSALRSTEHAQHSTGPAGQAGREVESAGQQ